MPGNDTMNDADQSSATGLQKPVYRKFRASGPKLSKERADRQGMVARAACDAFSDHVSLKAFLNEHHTELQGRPLDVAMDSDAGLSAVMRLLSRIASSTGGTATDPFDRAAAAHGPAFPTD